MFLTTQCSFPLVTGWTPSKWANTKITSWLPASPHWTLSPPWALSQYRTIIYNNQNTNKTKDISYAQRLTLFFLLCPRDVRQIGITLIGHQRRIVSSIQTLRLHLLQVQEKGFHVWDCKKDDTSLCLSHLPHKQTYVLSRCKAALFLQTMDWLAYFKFANSITKTACLHPAASHRQ